MAHTVHLEIPRSREVMGSAWHALWRSRRVAARGCGASDAPSAFHGAPGALGRDLQPGRPTWTSRRLARAIPAFVPAISCSRSDFASHAMIDCNDSATCGSEVLNHD